MFRDDYKKFPFITEKLAIEISNSLAGAEVGIRGFRNRKLLKRVVDFATGKDKELLSQNLSDVIGAQKAITDYLGFIVDSEIHTQRCLIKVAQNLHYFIRELQTVNKKLDNLEIEFSQKLIEYSEEITKQIAYINKNVEKNETLKVITSSYEIDDLHQGFSLIFRSALYIAYVANLYSDQNDESINTQVLYSKNIVQKKLSGINGPLTIGNILHKEIDSTQDIVLPMAIFITNNTDSSIIQLANMLFVRKYANLKIDDNSINDCIIMTEAISEDNFLSGGHIFTPYQCACAIAEDLIYGF